MSGYIARLTALRDALGDPQPDPMFDWGEMRYQPDRDALLRRVAERLSDDQCADVVELIKLARGSP